MDDADRAEGRIQASIIAGIDAARRASRLIPVGACYNCETIIGGGKIFCDSECREDFEVRRKQKR